MFRLRDKSSLPLKKEIKCVNHKSNIFCVCLCLDSIWVIMWLVILVDYDVISNFFLFFFSLFFFFFYDIVVDQCYQCHQSATPLSIDCFCCTGAVVFLWRMLKKCLMTFVFVKETKLEIYVNSLKVQNLSIPIPFYSSPFYNIL